MSNSAAHETLGRKILTFTVAGVTALATCAGFFVIGYEVGTGRGDEVKDLLQHEKDDAEERLRSKQAELELCRSRTPTQASRVTPQESAHSNQGEISPVDGQLQKEARGVPKETVEVYVSPGTSVPLFEGMLILSLVGVSFETSPSRYQAYFTLNATGSQPEEFRSADPGFSAAYQRYRVVLLETGMAGAKFRITRLNSTP